MQVMRLETVVQFVTDPERSRGWYARFLGVDSTPYEGPYFSFGDGAYLILASSSPGTGRGGSGVWFEVNSVDAAYAELKDHYPFTFDIPPGRLVTLNDPDGNVIGLIDNSRGGRPGRTLG